MTPRILIVSTMRDEAPHLVEWVAHNRAAGADDILVFSNDCTDGTDDLLDAMQAVGALTHVRNAVPEGRTPQWAALKQAADHPLTRRADWIAVLDADEFVNLRAPLSTLHDLISTIPGADAVVLPWRLFGNAGHVERPQARTIDAYTRAIAPDALYPPLSRFFKTLYRKAVMQKPGVHRPKQRAGPPPVWVDGSGRALPAALAADDTRILFWGAPLVTDLVQLNHYSVRSAQDFLLKRGRGLPNHTEKGIDLTYWVERNFNTVADDSIARMATATRAEYARLLAIPEVARAQARSDALTRATLARMLNDPETVQLYGRLCLSNGSEPPDAALSQHLVRLYRTATGGQS